MAHHNNKNYPELDHAFENSRVASSSESTGLLRVLPEDQSEVDNNTDIYNLPNQGSLSNLKREMIKED